MPEQPKKPRGRPSRKTEAARRIDPSGEGRLVFQRGDPHPLDVQLNEARMVGEALTTEATGLPELIAALEEYQQVPARLAAEDEDLAMFLGEHYADRKHVDHIQATLMIFRRKRALARVQAAEAALQLASALLSPDPLIPQLVEMIQEGPGAAMRANVDREQLAGSPRLIDQQLDQAKEHLRTIQAAMGQSNGWIDIQYVKRERVKREIINYVIALNKQKEGGTPVPEEVEAAIDPVLASIIKQRRPIPKELEPLVYEEFSYGPYPFFRWREESKGPVYAISLADETVEAPAHIRMAGYFAIPHRRRKASDE